MTEWVQWDGEALLPKWNDTDAEFAGLELYDHLNDFGSDFDAATATVNLAHEPQYAAVVKNLTAALRRQFNGDREPPQ